MRHQQSGFTLIELIAVIVILGILAATAVPRFVDLSSAAESATLQAMAGQLGSASALNHANNVAVDAGLTSGTTPIGIANCTDVADLLEGGLDSNYAITAQTFPNPGTEGEVATCTLTQSSTSNTAEFIAHAVVL